MNQINKQKNIFIQWFIWHFIGMPNFLVLIWRNYIVFSLDFFSAPLLLATLFSPWKKYSWGYPKFFSITEYLSTFISNFFSRIIGAICRIVLIILSVFVLAFIIFVGFIIILSWVLMPFIFIALITIPYGGI